MPGPDRRRHSQRENADAVARYLGDLQAEVLAVLWRVGDATVREVVEEMNANRRRKLAYTTVLTIVSRLSARGLLSRTPEGRGFRYRPTKSREELLAELSDELIDRLIDDFGEIALAQLGARIDGLDAKRRERLKEIRETG